MERLKQINMEIVNEIRKQNFVPENCGEFVGSIPIFYDNKLYYQTIVIKNGVYQLRPITFVNLLAKKELVYHYLMDLFSPNKIMTQKELAIVRSKVFRNVTDLKRYNFFDKVVNTYSCKKDLTIKKSNHFKIEYDTSGNITIYHPNRGQDESHLLKFYRRK